MAYVYSLVERERNRSRAIEVDAASVETADLAALWQALTEGRLAVFDHFSTQERHFLVLECLEASADAPKLSARQLNLLQRLLLGQPQKGLAIDYHLSASTVAGTLTETLRVLGLNVSASRAPALLSLMLHAYRRQATIDCGRMSTIEGERRLRVVSVRHLDEALGSKLSRAEQIVVRLRTEGRTHAEIAEVRRTSRRTIANQVASASRKLGVSGRSELLSYLSRGARPPSPEQQPGAQTVVEAAFAP